ncbi:MAG: MFS transporter [Pseudanabaena sp.]|jgi:MFS family permease|nr:MFS transporter [Pseudanabaena sp. M051S1SP1A06QC]MCA6604074.1 MFS transporter [Pseudanabaena sp. M007S1SP1A06QC]MCA6615597.1 MFS transporter [Pseudanabaena sp. M090S1SP1A06QC]MCE2976375.1 MFS transporter [Pseudanabaena sp. CoA8_M7]
MSQPDLNSTAGYLTVLRNRHFLALWIAQILSQLVDKIVLILLIAIAVSSDYKDYPVPVNTRESLIMIAMTLPAVFLGSIAGIFVDWHPKREVMILCNFLRGACIFVIPFLPHSLIVLLLITFIISTLTNIFAPAEQSAIPLIIPKSDLLPANALFTITMVGSLILGFAIGSPLLTWTMNLVPSAREYSRELLLGSIYILSGLVLFILPKDEMIEPQKEGGGIWADLKDGFKYVKHNHLIGGAMVQLVLLYAVLGTMQKLSLNLAEVVTNNRDDFGFFVASVGVGLAIGAFILGQFGDRFTHRPLPFVGFIGMAIGLLMFAFVSNLWVGLAVGSFIGIHGAMIAIPMQTAIQEHTPENMRGKVFGLLNNGENIAASLPLALIAIALDIATSTFGGREKGFLGFQIVLIVFSIIVIALGTWAWKRTKNALQKVL